MMMLQMRVQIEYTSRVLLADQNAIPAKIADVLIYILERQRYCASLTGSLSIAAALTVLVVS